MEECQRHDGSPAHTAAGHCPLFPNKVKGQTSPMIISRQDLHCIICTSCHPASVAMIHPVQIFLPSLRDPNVWMGGVTAEYRRNSGSSIVLWFKNLFFSPSDCQFPRFSPSYFPLFPSVLSFVLNFPLSRFSSHSPALPSFPVPQPFISM